MTYTFSFTADLLEEFDLDIKYDEDGDIISVVCCNEYGVDEEIIFPQIMIKKINKKMLELLKKEKENNC